MAICGTKIMMPPMPGIIPSTIRLVSTPAGSASFSRRLRPENMPSIQFMGTSAQEKIAWKTRNKMREEYQVSPDPVGQDFIDFIGQPEFCVFIFGDDETVKQIGDDA